MTTGIDRATSGPSLLDGPHQPAVDAEHVVQSRVLRRPACLQCSEIDVHDVRIRRAREPEHGVAARDKVPLSRLLATLPGDGDRTWASDMPVT